VSGEIEGIGDVVTGAALARAVETAAGEGVAERDGRACLNCGAPLAAAFFCGACGQKTRVHRTLTEFAHDALHSVLHFDGKIWRTLPLLAWKPGDLTRRYIHGERVKFVSPLALFLFCVFLAYAVFGVFVPRSAGLDPVTALAEGDVALTEVRAEAAKEIEALEQKRAKPATDKAERAEIDSELAQLRSATLERETKLTTRLRRSKEMLARIQAERARNEAAIATLNARLEEARKAGESTQTLDDEMLAEQFNRKLWEGGDDALMMALSDGPSMKLKLGGQQISIVGPQEIKNPQLLLYKLQSNAYKFAWALIPISVPFVWLLFFWKREFKLFDHAVFVTYSLCFMLILATLLGLASRFEHANEAINLALLVVAPVHMYRQVHQAYKLGLWSSVWRTALLLAFAATALGLFAAALLRIGASG
jgi:hypothetical protein